MIIHHHRDAVSGAARGARPGVEPLPPSDVADVVEVLCASFFDYPVMRFVLGSADPYQKRLERLVRFFVMARVLRDEVVLGVRGPDGLEGVALVSAPGQGKGPAALAAIRQETWSELGRDARTRYEAFGATARPLMVDAPHLYLNMIGVRPGEQGRGLGRALLEAVHELSAADARSTGVALTTEVERNVTLYERFGYEIVGSAEVKEAFTTWAMYRVDR